MTARAVRATALAGALALAGGAVAHAATAHRRDLCTVARIGGTPIYSTATIRVVDISTVSGDVYEVCVRATGVRRVLERIPNSDGSGNAESIVGYLAQGPWLIWVTDSPAHDVQRTIEPATGRRGPTVTVSVASPPTLTAADGPLAQGRGSSILAGVAIAPDGNAAWTVLATVPGTNTVDQGLYTGDNHGGDKLLDSGPEGAITAVRSVGDTVHWRHSGQPRQAAFG